MRIIGGHDYYDSAAASGMDPDVVFLRKPATMKALEFLGCSDRGSIADRVRPLLSEGEKRTNWRNSANRGWEFQTRDFTFAVRFHTVVFAGRRYGGARVIPTYTWGRPAPEPEFFWAEDRLSECLADYGVRIDDHRGWRDKSDLDIVRRHFTAELSPQEVTWLIENRVTVAIAFMEGKSTTWSVNGVGLKEVGFQKVMPPYQAWQELSMWVGGTLPRNPNPIVEITDDRVKAEKHGFDKWSFRKKVR